MKCIEHYNYKKNNYSKKISEILSKIDVEILMSKKTNDKSKFVANLLNKSNLGIKLLYEHTIMDGLNDRVDVYAKIENLDIIIEIDNLRADQVIKKLFSRTMMIPSGENLLYISLCYSTKGNPKHTEKECVRYINTHVKEYLSRNKHIEYIAFIPEKLKYNL